ncbi:unnamed protein product [Closterium sp. NIES-53]
MARSALSVGLALFLAAFLVLSCVSYAQATSAGTGVDAAEDVASITQPNKAHEQRHRKLQTTADNSFCRTVYSKGATWCPTRFKGNVLAITTCTNDLNTQRATCGLQLLRN